MVAIEPSDRQDDTQKFNVWCRRNPAQLLCHGLNGLATFSEICQTAGPSNACWRRSSRKQAERSAHCAEVETLPNKC